MENDFAVCVYQNSQRDALAMESLAQRAIFVVVIRPGDMLVRKEFGSRG
jgi:putative heme iron utilization protein